MTDFYQKFAEIVEEENIVEQTQFRELENWDSLSLLVFLSMVDSDYGVTINADDIEKLDTVGQLEAIVKEKRR